MTCSLLLAALSLILCADITRAEDHLSTDFEGPRPPKELLAVYARFVEAARLGDSKTLESCFLDGAVAFSSTPRNPNSREYGEGVDLPFLRDGFGPVIVRSRSADASQFLLRTSTTVIYFVNVELVGWRIYRYRDKPIE